jgi:hypothetical protein
MKFMPATKRPVVIAPYEGRNIETIWGSQILFRAWSSPYEGWQRHRCGRLLSKGRVTLTGNGDASPARVDSATENWSQTGRDSPQGRWGAQRGRDSSQGQWGAQTGRDSSGTQ